VLLLGNLGVFPLQKPSQLIPEPLKAQFHPSRRSPSRHAARVRQTRFGIPEMELILRHRL